MSQVERIAISEDYNYVYTRMCPEVNHVFLGRKYEDKFNTFAGAYSMRYAVRQVKHTTKYIAGAYRGLL
jgi:hypothetical protein